MQPPKSAEIFETPNSKYWFDEEDMLMVVMKNAAAPELEEQKRQTEEFLAKLDGKKICCIIDFSNASYTPASAESREYNNQQVTKMFKAIACVSHNVVTRMLAHLFLGFRTPPLPIKVFSNETEAREWLRQ